MSQHHQVYEALYATRGINWRDAVVMAYGREIYDRLLWQKDRKDYFRINERSLTREDED